MNAGMALLAGVLAIPGISAVLLVLIPGYRLSSRVNVLASLLTFLVAAALFRERPAPGL